MKTLTIDEWMNKARRNVERKKHLCNNISCFECPVGQSNCLVDEVGKKSSSVLFFEKHNWTKKLELL